MPIIGDLSASMGAGTISSHAAKGKWNIQDAGKAAIFVNIAAYRDPETQATLKDLFAKAAHPERIYAGICLQVDPAEDKACMVDESIRPGRIRTRQYHYHDSKGANWARAEAQKLWNGEEYVLQIDSHMRLTPGWDDALVDMLNRCPPGAILSTYAPRYTPPDNKDAYPDQILRIRVHMFGEEGSSQLLHLTKVPVPLSDTQRSGLYLSPFYVANFMFCRASVIQEIPFDPHIRFWGDEITYSARLWTHGYDIYQPDKVVLYHYWRRDELVPMQPYRRQQNEQGKRSLARVKHLLGFEQAKDPEALREIERYGLGGKRSLADLWRFIGVDWQKRTIAKEALEGRWNLTNHEFIPPPSLPASGGGVANHSPRLRGEEEGGISIKKRASIFVNIAATAIRNASGR